MSVAHHLHECEVVAPVGAPTYLPGTPVDGGLFSPSGSAPMPWVDRTRALALR